MEDTLLVGTCRQVCQGKLGSHVQCPFSGPINLGYHEDKGCPRKDAGQKRGCLGRGLVHLKVFHKGPKAPLGRPVTCVVITKHLRET